MNKKMKTLALLLSISGAVAACGEGEAANIEAAGTGAGEDIVEVQPDDDVEIVEVEPDNDDSDANQVVQPDSTDRSVDDPEEDSAEVEADADSDSNDETDDLPVAPPENGELISPVTLEEAVEGITGLTREAADAWAEDNNMFLRVVSQDGEEFAVTQDYSPNRLNVAVDAGTITGVRSIG